jgi:hypothetical protein
MVFLRCVSLDIPCGGVVLWRWCGGDGGVVMVVVVMVCGVVCGVAL